MPSPNTHDVAPGPPKTRLSSEWSRSLRVATKWFFISRLVLVVAAVAAATWVPPGDFFGPPRNPIFRALIVWDCGWYIGIAKGGYYFDPNTPGQYPVAFLPLHPMLIRAVGSLLGSGLDALCWGALAINNLLFWGVLVLMHRFVNDDLPDVVADRATFLLAFFPATIACMSAYSEPLFLVFVLAAFLCMRRGCIVQSGLWSLLAGLTRPFGVLMPFVALAGALQARQRNESVKPWLCAAAIAPLGLLAWHGYLWARFGDPLAFHHAQQMGWRPHVTTASEFLAGLQFHLQGIWHGQPGQMSFPYGLLLLSAATLVKLARMNLPLRAPMVAYQAGCIFLTTVPATPVLDGSARYVMIQVPMYIALAAWSVEHRLGGRLLAFFFVADAVACAAIFTRGYWPF